MTKKILAITGIVIALISLYPYFHLLTAVYNYPFSIYLDEGTYIRKALIFMNDGIAFTDIHQYPYVVTVYGFLYELAITPFLLIMEPSVTAGRIVTLISTVLIIIFLYRIIYRKTGSHYFSAILSGTIIFFKLLAVYTAYCKNDMFLALMTLVVLYSLYFHLGRKQFIVTLLFTSLALMTKQTSVFIVPVVLTVWFMNRKNMREFTVNSAIWLASLTVIFGILFLVIPNYFYNTFIVTSQVTGLIWSYKHMIFSQTIPMLRSLSVYIIIALVLAIINKKQNKKVITPALLYIIYYMPIFFWTSMNTGSMPVYYIFPVIGLTVYLAEQIKNYGSKITSAVYGAICVQLIIFLLFSSSVHFFRFYYPEPTGTEIAEAREIDKIVREHNIENSFSTFSFNSFGLSRKSAKNTFDFNLSYLADMNRLNLTPYINDFNSKRYSVIIGGFDYPGVREAIDKNYYMYKQIGGTAVFLPKPAN